MATPSVSEFPDLPHANEQAQKAATLLETATHNLTHYPPDEPAEARAQRLRGAAILCVTAALEVANVAGWHEAAHAAAVHGLVSR
jgi:hypothetical protein